MADRDEICENCRFYVSRNHSGECRRHAPMGMRMEHPEYGKWPWVHAGDRCGDFEATPEVRNG